MSGHPRVSVLMPAYQAAPFIREAVESVLAQTFTDLELLVLDDGSTDGSAEVLAGLDDPRLRVVRRPHRGMAAARNDLLALARGELVAVMDADDVMLPERLAHQVAFLDGHPEIGAVGGWSEWFGDTARIDGLPVEDRDIRRLLRTGTAVIDGAMTARAHVLRMTGGYDLGALWVDWDMDLRLASVSRLHNLPEVVIRYRRHAGSLQRGVARARARREKLRRRIQAAGVLGWRPRSLLDVGAAAAAALLYRILDGPALPALPPARTFTVVIPTFRRPALLRRCLRGVADQTRLPDEVVMVVRDDDAPTRAEAARWVGERRGWRLVSVDEPGQVAALAAGAAAATGDVVAFLDDDAVPEPGWLAALASAYGPFVAGVGGRVVEVPEAGGGRARRVGRVSRLGRITGRMHLDAPDQEVDWLTGGNTSYRRALLRPDRRLRRSAHGVEFGNDVSMGLAVRASGYRLRFVSGARVWHSSASPRDPVSGLRTVTSRDVEAAAHNLLVAVASPRRGLARALAIAFWAAVGSRTAPGPLRAAAGLLLGDLVPMRRLGPARRGRAHARETLRAEARDEEPVRQAGEVAA